MYDDVFMVKVILTYHDFCMPFKLQSALEWFYVNDITLVAELTAMALKKNRRLLNEKCNSKKTFEWKLQFILSIKIGR